MPVVKIINFWLWILQRDTGNTTGIYGNGVILSLRWQSGSEMPKLVYLTEIVFFMFLYGIDAVESESEVRIAEFGLEIGENCI